MKGRKKAKFNIGDTVVITMYGTVGKVTEVKWLDGVYVYKINGNDGLFMENSLQNIEEYKGKIIEKEQIEINCKYLIGDLVQVKNHGVDLFRIVGFRTEIWRYKEDAWEDIIYELGRITDGEWLEASEDELIFIADRESAEQFVQKLSSLYLIPKEQPKLTGPNKFRMREREILKRKLEYKQLIDQLLDLYNDYQTLYQMFGDEEYKQFMTIILKRLEMEVEKGKNTNG